MKLFVSNLSYSLSSDDVRELFSQFGEIESATVVNDHYTGLSRGFGFVKLSSDEHAQDAIAGLNGFKIAGRTLDVRVSASASDSRKRAMDQPTGYGPVWQPGR